ncbi:MAG: response regulator [Planctomycetes bacterium]|nr:response regulator [Planctomycetota bacterium]
MVNAPVKILIAEDEPTMLSLMSTILEGQEGCVLRVAANGEEALERVRGEHPDLLITDLKMPRMGGEELTSRALSLQPDLTILVATGNGTLESAVDLMKRGVFDYITKPFDVDDFLTRVGRAVEKVRMMPLSPDSQAIIGSLMRALETKDPYLKNHSSRVASLARQLGLDLGLSYRDALLVERAGLVHDLGKIGVPEAILNKQGPLTAEEYDQVKRHPIYSADIVRPLKEFKECLREVYHHHERMDGKGYPDGLAGEDIPLGARILSVCDTYDAMASDRPYRSGLPEETIRAKLLEARGSHLEGDFVDVFLKRTIPS